MLKEQLTSSVKEGHIPHARLFLGAEGSGSLALALAYAQLLQCENPTDTDSCGVCSACSKASKFSHPDIHFSYPTIGTGVVSTKLLPEWRKALNENPYMDINVWLNLLGAENKQGNINKDECLDIVRKLSFKTYEGEYKILIMWLPEFLGKEGNRLLKLIEEPPEQTVFLLVAEQQEQILSTIISRCQLVKVDSLTDDDVCHALIEQQNLSPDAARQIAYLSEGNYNKALELAEDADNPNSELFVEWLRICFQNKPTAMVPWVEKIAGGVPINGRKYGRKDQKNFLQFGFHFLREMLAGMVGGADVMKLLPKEKEAAIKLSQMPAFGYIQIESISHLLSECISHIERNANPRVLFLDTSIEIAKIFKVVR